MVDFKNRLNQKVDIYIGKKLVSIGPRKTFKASEKDIETSPQLQELLKRNVIRQMGGKAVKVAAGGKQTESKEKSK